jgi:hypothetical protein
LHITPLASRSLDLRDARRVIVIVNGLIDDADERGPERQQRVVDAV